MAAKPEEAIAASVEAASAPGGASVGMQPETSETIEKKDEAAAVEATTASAADLSVAEKKEEDKTAEETGPAATTTTTTDEATPSNAQPNAEAAEKPSASPEASTVTPTQGPIWPETAPDHPLTKFYDAFEDLVTSASHNEVYGIELTKAKPFHTKLILQKLLRANQNDVEKAKTQLLETLKWRRQFDPIKAASETYDKAKFDGLGYVLEVEGVPESPNDKDIVTFNIYGAVKDNKATFGDLDLYVLNLLIPTQAMRKKNRKRKETGGIYANLG